MKKNDLIKFILKFYKNKDMMHDLTHINRIIQKAKIIGRTIKHSKTILETATYLHGCIYSNEIQIRQFLKKNKLKQDTIELIINTAWESQKESLPQTTEGKIFHDAHLLEGDDYFIITKCLITGTIQKQKLRETIKFIKNNVIGKYKCIFPKNQIILKRREKIALRYITSYETSADS